MAITPIIYTDFNNAETGLNIRSKLNTLGSDVENLSTETIALETRVGSLESKHNLPFLSVASNGLPTQTLVANTPVVLNWMENVVVDHIGTGMNYDIPTSHITILENGIYKIFGSITLDAPINDIIDIELYINNIPSGFKASAIGRGTTASIPFNYSFLRDFVANDDINLYVNSTGTSITISTDSITVEKTEY